MSNMNTYLYLSTINHSVSKASSQVAIIQGPYFQRGIRRNLSPTRTNIVDPTQYTFSHQTSPEIQIVFAIYITFVSIMNLNL